MIALTLTRTPRGDADLIPYGWTSTASNIAASRSNMMMMGRRSAPSIAMMKNGRSIGTLYAYTISPFVIIPIAMSRDD